MIGRVFEDINVATETKIHLVVRQEMEMDARVAINLQCILNIETIEADGILADR